MKLSLILLFADFALAGRENCYKLLGVDKKETNKKIKSAYRYFKSLVSKPLKLIL